MLKSRMEALNWLGFTIRFLEKYFIDKARFVEEAKLIRLVQGDMLVHAYA